MSTPAQEEAAKQAFRLLQAHFPAFVIITREDDEVSDKFQCIEVSYTGGYYNALGMVTRVQQAFDKFTTDSDESDDQAC